MADKAERYAFFKTQAQIEMGSDIRATNTLGRHIEYCNEHPWYERGIFGQRMLYPEQQRGGLESRIRDEDTPEFGLATLASFGGNEGWW